MNENQFSRDLRKSFDIHYSGNAWIRKMVGGPFVTPGIPDLLGVINGRFIGIECKQIKMCPKLKTSKIWDHIFTQAQIDNLFAIETAGGYARGIINFTFYSPQKAIVLTPASIKAFEIATLEDLEGLIASRHQMFLTRLKGIWNVDTLKFGVPSKYISQIHQDAQEHI